MPSFEDIKLLFWGLFGKSSFILNNLLIFLSVYTGCRMGFYEYLRDNVLKKDDDGYFPLWFVNTACCSNLLLFSLLQGLLNQLLC